MNTDISKLLREAANTFVAIAEAYEQDMRQTEDHLAFIEQKTEENREALKSAADAILRTLH